MVTKSNMLTCVASIVLYALFTDGATAGTYTLSAHGNDEFGVKRITIPSVYVAGNCTHCHGQHSSIDNEEPIPVNNQPSPFALFAPTFNTAKRFGPYDQSDLFCFYCHTDSGSYQEGGGYMVNKDYAETFAGATGGPDSIMTQFNEIGTGGSNHNLYDLWFYMKEHPEYGAKNGGWFTEYSDPCTACHNPHLARRNKEHLTDAGYATISRPTDHFDQWGDDEFEQMSDYSSIYQAPFYVYSGNHPTDVNTATYEPAGVELARADGQLTPNYNDFCLDCHKDAIYSNNENRQLSIIDWSTEKHGVPNATSVMSRTPYGRQGGYVLSCLDCHEAHGSPNKLLIRRSINGVIVGDIGVTEGDRGNQCRQCHMDDEAYKDAGYNSMGGINKWKYPHHGRIQGASPYSAQESYVPNCGCHNYDGAHSAPDPIPCEICHYHGSFVPNPAGDYPATLTPRNAPYERKMF